MDHLVTIRRPAIMGEIYGMLQDSITAWLKQQGIAYAAGRPRTETETGAVYAEMEAGCVLIHYRFSNHVDATAFKVQWG